MLKNKNKKIFKLNNWKRWLILFLTLGVGIVFIGLSFGLRVSETKLTNDYKNGITLVIKPTQNGEKIEDTDQSFELLENLKERLETHFTNSYVSYEAQENNVWKIDVTNILNKNQKDEFLRFLVQKNAITLTRIDDKISTGLYQNTLNHNNLFNDAKIDNSVVTLTLDQVSSKNFYNWAISNGISKNSTILIWKNFDIYKQIVQNAIDNENYSGTLYEYLFLDNKSPENLGATNDNKDNIGILSTFFKDYFELNGKKYRVNDFLISKNELSNFESGDSIYLLKEFLSKNYSISNSEIVREFYEINYWISNYDLNNYVASFNNANNGHYAFQFLFISLVTIYAVLSIYVVINYGYLGLFAIFILSVIIAFMFLIMSFLFGDYDSIAIISLFVGIVISLDFIISFFNSIKNQFIKGNSINKAIKTTINKTKNNLFLKSFVLILFLSITYGMLSLVFDKFIIIVLFHSILVPLFLIPILFAFSRLLVGMKKFEYNPKLIGFWKKEYKFLIERNYFDEEDINESLGLDETLDINPNTIKHSEHYESVLLKHKSKNWMNFAKFKKFIDSKVANFISIGAFAYILIFGLLIFLVSYFINDKNLMSSLFLSENDQELTLITIGKFDKTDFTNEEFINIKDILLKNNFLSKNIFKIGNSMIQAKSSYDLSNDINKAILDLSLTYNLVIIPSQLVSNSNSEIIKFTYYAILLAIVVSSLFIFIWMKWTNALAFLFVCLISLISFILMIGFHLVQFDFWVSIALCYSFITLILSSITVISRSYYKLKTIRIEEQLKDDIKNIVYKQTFKVIKPIIFSNLVSIILLVLSMNTIVSNSLFPILFILFTIGTILVTLIFVLILLPKIIVFLESLKSVRKRNIILKNYWDTEKIKEQTFKGINSIE